MAQEVLQPTVDHLGGVLDRTASQDSPALLRGAAGHYQVDLGEKLLPVFRLECLLVFEIGRFGDEPKRKLLGIFCKKKGRYFIPSPSFKIVARNCDVS